MKTGDNLSNVVTYTQDMVIHFARISGDHNPIHLSREYASKTIFKKPIVHGLLVASQISSCIAQIPGAIYIHQTLNFRKPVYTGQRIYCTATVTKTSDSIVHFITTCTNGENVVIDGEAIIKIQKYDRKRTKSPRATI